MQEIDDVTISLWLDGRQVNIGEYSVVEAKFEANSQPVIQLATYRRDLIGLEFWGRRRQRVDFREPYEEDGIIFYEHVVPIALSLGPPSVPYTPPTTNALQLLEYTETGFRQYQVGLIGQNGHFFLFTQLSHEARLYQQNGRLCCPEYDQEWWQLAEAAIQRASVSAYPKLRLPVPLPPKVSLKNLPPNSGYVMWYNVCTGFGVIETRRNEYVRVRWSQAPVRPGGLRYLLPNEVVIFDPFTPAECRHRGVNFEVTGVELVPPANTSTVAP